MDWLGLHQRAIAGAVTPQSLQMRMQVGHRQISFGLQKKGPQAQCVSFTCKAAPEHGEAGSRSFLLLLRDQLVRINCHPSQLFLLAMLLLFS